MTFPNRASRSRIRLVFPFLMLAAAGISLAAEPTAERQWTSTAGTRLTAVAMAIEGASVRFKSAGGKESVVPLAKLVAGDREFLGKHFGLAEMPAATADSAIQGKSAPLSTQLPHPVGEVSGPHEAGNGSHFFIYIPKTLKQNRKAPLLLFTGAGGGNAGSVKSHIKGAELNGWVVAASVESKNNVNTDINQAHAKRCVEHLIETLPIDPERLYFTGNSGGGAMAFNNSVQMKSAGAMPIIGYNQFGKLPRNAHYYVLGGATDFNRYLSADAAAEARDRGFHRIYPGGHAGAPSWILDEAMTWLNGRYLADNKSKSALADERLDWEAAMIAWINGMKATEAHRAYYWSRFLQDDCKISGPNAAPLSAIAAELAKDPVNMSYAEGMAAINDFSKRYYTGMGSGSSFGHTTPKIESAAAKLQEKFAGVPHVGDVVKQIGLKTGK